jgi:hypothetical protein
MLRLLQFGRSAMAFAVVAVIAACSSDTAKVFAPAPVDPLFASYVSLGNSVTAGYQSGGINASTQVTSYAVLAANIMRTRFVIPTLAGRGCAPPVIDFTTQVRFGTGSTSTTCDLRAAATATINNVAVPGATVADLTAPAGTARSNILTSLFLGGQSQVEKALENDPTFATVWIGNNDVLAAALSGILGPVAGISPGVTPVADFTADFEAAMDQLTTGAPGLEGVLFAVLNVANLPVLFPTDSLVTNPVFRAYFELYTGRDATSGDPYKAAPLQFDPNCLTNRTTLISFLIAPQIARFRNDTNPTGDPPKPAAERVGHPPYIACGATNLQPSPVGIIFILEASEQAILANVVAAYNGVIAAKATELGWGYVDPNLLLAPLKASGAIPAIPDLTSATAPFGAYFSLDGIHPSALAHRAVIANALLLEINETYDTDLEALP